VFKTARKAMKFRINGQEKKISPMSFVLPPSTCSEIVWRKGGREGAANVINIVMGIMHYKKIGSEVVRV
jgi:hypothetical protein